MVFNNEPVLWRHTALCFICSEPAWIVKQPREERGWSSGSGWCHNNENGDWRRISWRSDSNILTCGTDTGVCTLTRRVVSSGWSLGLIIAQRRLSGEATGTIGNDPHKRNSWRLQSVQRTCNPSVWPELASFNGLAVWETAAGSRPLPPDVMLLGSLDVKPGTANRRLPRQSMQNWLRRIDLESAQIQEYERRPRGQAAERLTYGL